MPRSLWAGAFIHSNWTLNGGAANLQARSQSMARTAVERWCVSGSIAYGRHSPLVVVQGGDGDAGIARTALHARTFAVTPHLLQGTAYAYSSL